MAPRESSPAAMRCCDGLTLPPIMLRTCSITCIKAARYTLPQPYILYLSNMLALTRQEHDAAAMVMTHKSPVLAESIAVHPG